MSNEITIIRHELYGPCVLRAFYSYYVYLVHRTISMALCSYKIVPLAYEYYEFSHLNSDEEITKRLTEMGFPSNIKIIKRHIGIKRLGLLQYTGEPLIDVIAKFKDNKNSLNTILKNLIFTVATLHKFGIVVDDTHIGQFTAEKEI